MHHNTIDQYAKNSSFYLLDPRAKIIALITFTVIVAFLRDALILAITFGFVLAMLAISRIPWLHILKRYVIALPFIVFAVLTMYLTSSPRAAISMFFRISACVLALLFLTTTTLFFDLLKALQRLRLPKIFVALLMFCYRYIFLFTEELQRMKLARIARGFRGGKHMLDRRGMKLISYTIGMVLVRAYARGQQTYDALIARGYDGRIRTINPSRFGALELSFCLLFAAVSGMLLYSDWIVRL